MTLALDNLDVLKLKADSFRRVLNQTPQLAKKNHVTMPISDEFNRLLDEVATAFPDVAEALPKKITAVSPARLAGYADVKLMELEILSEQLVGLLDLLISKRQKVRHGVTHEQHSSGLRK
ncbi:MAG: hypothetical protein HY000_01050 [Planctomycetes bacterium]|nr:hypothetical protein [Planctomycetota bacterium]